MGVDDAFYTLVREIRKDVSSFSTTFLDCYVFLSVRFCVVVVVVHIFFNLFYFLKRLKGEKTKKKRKCSVM